MPNTCRAAPRLSRKRSRFAGPGAIAALLLGLAAGFTAPPARPQSPAAATPRELLNSERIEQRFGSYGVAVLSTDPHTRVSSLYSDDPTSGTAICRTFAVVRYPDTLDPRLAPAHAEILAGGSIGAVLSAHGWRVQKTHVGYDETAATERLAALMRVAPGVRLARHAYVLDVQKAGETLAYAALVEIHHPDYLRVADLPATYGAPSAAGREALLASLIAAATAEASR